MSSTKKTSKLRAIFGFKCPNCHQGNLFPTRTFSYKKPFDMYEECPVCQQDFAPEPGYYYGAMFISYIFTGFFCLGYVMFTHWVLDWSMALSFGTLIAICLIFFVFVFRLARSLYINIDQSISG
jgi:uncharacterized protein (DUF983 family)